MSSSTSSSEPVRSDAGEPGRRAGQAWRTWLLVLVVLVFIEGGVRAIEDRLSVDIQHIRSIHDIADSLDDEGETTGARTVLFLGNSLTRRGLDQVVFEKTLESEGVDDLAFAEVYPDDTAVLDWLYLYGKEIAPAGTPDFVVIDFGFWHLEDRSPWRAQTYRLGRHFVSWSALPRLFRDDVTSLADRANVALSKVSATFANRERVARRALSFLPYYEVSAQQINDLASPDDAGGADAAPESYDRLTRLIRTVEDSGAELVLVAMPTREGYDLDSRIAEIAAANGAVLVDARTVPNLGEEDFADPIHLDPDTGAALYSEHAAELLAPILAGGGPVR